ncbi:MAG: hypothetical protein ACLSE6_01175 [Alphaproteobacteria bacterium]
MRKPQGQSRTRCRCRTYPDDQESRRFFDYRQQIGGRIKLEGDAKANAEKQMQLASVEAQLKLASEIGNNDGYQHYLIQVRQIEANESRFGTG